MRDDDRGGGEGILLSDQPRLPLLASGLRFASMQARVKLLYVHWSHWLETQTFSRSRPHSLSTDYGTGYTDTEEIHILLLAVELWTVVVGPALISQRCGGGPQIRT